MGRGRDWGSLGFWNVLLTWHCSKATLPGYIDIVLPLLLSNADSKMAQAWGLGRVKAKVDCNDDNVVHLSHVTMTSMTSSSGREAQAYHQHEFFASDLIGRFDAHCPAAPRAARGQHDASMGDD